MIFDSISQSQYGANSPYGPLVDYTMAILRLTASSTRVTRHTSSLPDTRDVWTYSQGDLRLCTHAYSKERLLYIDLIIRLHLNFYNDESYGYNT